ncbi:class I SAM-dependent methyltransferase [Desulfurivibrio sp. C05AmB]|uniref:class I SAM-dependent methyltransferase n=1 Tax=Desulfurivibrio sp. C05AmB TaxID=3374371 RepID=UPI00376EF357
MPDKRRTGAGSVAPTRHPRPEQDSRTALVDEPPGLCPVCRAGGPQPFLSVGDRDYRRCPTCAATLLEPGQRPGPALEYRHYLQHENDPADPAYRRFLARLAEPLLLRLAPGARGLDYGCGPGPALAAMLAEAGHPTALYDPFFCPDPAPLEQTYDFITCTEAIEHFHRPAAEFDRLGQLLRPGGWLAVMTCFQTDDARFAVWHYRQDPTHVVFYREATLRLLAAQRGWSCEIPAKDVALMRKPATGEAGVDKGIGELA